MSFDTGQVLAEGGAVSDRLLVIVQGRAEKRARGRYGEEALLEVVGDGQFFDLDAWTRAAPMPYQVTAVTPGTALCLDRAALAGWSTATRRCAPASTPTWRPTACCRAARCRSTSAPDTSANPTCRRPSSTTRTRPASTT
ncbi:cyclic nucleotide-binding domain-containing protein [Streptomyces albulus]|nr:cyclic nucleotide-binding domain-containing protein [Streptomyces noursei]